MFHCASLSFGYFLCSRSRLRSGSQNFDLITTFKFERTAFYIPDNYPVSSGDFYSLLQRFLFSLEGRGYLRFIKPNDLMNISNIQVSLKFDIVKL